MRLPRLRLPDRLIGKRPTGDAGALWDQLDATYRAMATWQAELEREVVTRLHPSPIRYANCVARIGEITRVDARDQLVTVQLPPAPQDTAGMELAIDPSGDTHVLLLAVPGETVAQRAQLYIARACRLTSSGAGDWILSETVTGWQDVQGSAQAGNAVAALSLEEYFPGGYGWHGLWMRDDQADQLDYAWQMNHTWDERTPVRPHLHFQGMAATAGTFAVRGYWAWLPVGVALGPGVAWTAYTASRALTSADQYVHRAMLLFEATPPAGDVASSFLLASIIRDSGGADTYTGNAGGTMPITHNIHVLGSDVHVWGTRPGTRTEYAGAES